MSILLPRVTNLNNPGLPVTARMSCNIDCIVVLKGLYCILFHLRGENRLQRYDKYLNLANFFQYICFYRGKSVILQRFW